MKASPVRADNGRGVVLTTSLSIPAIRAATLQSGIALCRYRLLFFPKAFRERASECVSSITPRQSHCAATRNYTEQHPQRALFPAETAVIASCSCCYVAILRRRAASSESGKTHDGGINLATFARMTIACGQFHGLARQVACFRPNAHPWGESNGRGRCLLSC